VFKTDEVARTRHRLFGTVVLVPEGSNGRSSTESGTLCDLIVIIIKFYYVEFRFLPVALPPCAVVCRVHPVR